MATRNDGGQAHARVTAVISCGVRLVWRNNVEHVVRNARPLFRGRFGGANFQFAIHGHGVATDDLAVKTLCQLYGQGGLSTCSCAEKDDEERSRGGRIGSVYHSLHQRARKMACQPARYALKRRIASANHNRPTIWRRRRARSAGAIIVVCTRQCLRCKESRSAARGTAP